MHLPQLREPGRYRACDWDLRADAAGRARWLALFRWHLDGVLVPLIREEYPAATAAQLADLRADYLAQYAELEARPQAQDRIDVLRLTELREAVLARHGWPDPFRGVKQRENEAALALLPGVLAEIDAAPPAEQQGLLAVGLLAGNIFDLGSKATIERHRSGETAFHASRAAQPPRPWRVDHVDAWWQRWDGRPPYRHALFFVDNAGGDIVLGGLPLARWMLARGTRVTLAANTGPALNDITAAELAPLVERCAAHDRLLAGALADGRLRVAATGSTAPLIDLTRLSPEFAAAAADADLVVLHGMGRAVESNYCAAFRCDVLRTAVLKDDAVAGRIGAGLFDCIFRFDPA